jgi:hypothetical protein
LPTKETPKAVKKAIVLATIGENTVDTNNSQTTRI